MDPKASPLVSSSEIDLEAGLHGHDTTIPLSLRIGYERHQQLTSEAEDVCVKPLAHEGYDSNTQQMTEKPARRRSTRIKILVYDTEPCAPKSPVENPRSRPACPNPMPHQPMQQILDRSRTMLRKVGALSPSQSLSHFSKYRRLQDGAETLSPFEQDTASHQQIEQEDFSYVDFSTLEGPKEMQTFGPEPTIGRSNAKSLTHYNMLELKGHLTGGLGRGMGSFREPKQRVQCADDEEFVSRSKVGSITTSVSTCDEENCSALVKTACPTIAEELEVVDLSNAEGFPYSPEEPDQSNDLAKKSYYFPPDPQMPDWRPFPMHRAYTIFLILMALTLAGVEEYLCQLSQKLSSEPQGGLLKFTSPRNLSNINYIAWKYLPTLILVLYGVMWQTMDFEVKRLEPYYQLSQPTGSPADESLNIDYLTFWSALVPFKALHYKQWAVMLSSVATILASTLTPIFQSAAVYTERIQGQQRNVRIDPIWSRMMEATLILVAIIGTLLLVQLRRKSGLLSNPQGVAGLAAMANRSHILTEFKGEDDEIHKQLQNRRYILHKSSLWQGEYREVNHDSRPKQNKTSQPIMLRLKFGILYIGFLLVFFALIPVFIFTNANVALQKLPWLLTAIATVVQLFWSTLESNIRMTEPFYILSQRHAPPKTLTLDYTGTVPFWLPFKALCNKHYIVFIVAFGSMLTQILTVIASSFDADGKKFFPGYNNTTNSITNTSPSSPSSSNASTDQTFTSFWVSLCLALFILLALAVIATTVYARRHRPFLPREQGTIASVLAYIHQSKMLYDFVGTEEFDVHRMTRHLEALGKTYGFGWYRGRDGEDHCGIDAEPLLADYTWGEDWRRGRVSAAQVGRWEFY